MMTQAWRARLLIAIGGAMLALTGIGLFLQSRNALHPFIIVTLGQGALYLLAAWLVWRGGFSRRALIGILGVALAMRLALLLSPPYLSDDFYRYVWDGRVEAAGINPYRYIPADDHLAFLRDEAIYPNINRRDYARTIYPPAAETIFFLTTRISESATWMRATMVGLELASMAILLRLLGLAGLPRERILVYAWHPVALWEFAGAGHIDAAIVTFLALTLWARRREAAWLTGMALAGAALVKFFPAVIFPALYRRWDWRMPLAMGALVILAYLPFLSAGPAVFGFLPGYVSEEGLSSGSGFFLWNLAHAALPIAATGAWPYLIFAGAVLALLGIYVVFSESTDTRYIAAAAWLAAAFTMLLSPHFPWYFTWILTFLCFVPSAAILYLTVASLALHFISGGPDLDGSRMIVESAIYGPFAILAVIELRRRLAGAKPVWFRKEA